MNCKQRCGIVLIEARPVENIVLDIIGDYSVFLTVKPEDEALVHPALILREAIAIVRDSLSGRNVVNIVKPAQAFLIQDLDQIILSTYTFIPNLEFIGFSSALYSEEKGTGGLFSVTYWYLNLAPEK